MQFLACMYASLAYFPPVAFYFRNYEMSRNISDYSPFLILTMGWHKVVVQQTFLFSHISVLLS